MEKNKKIYVSNEVADFIQSYNAMSIHSKSSDTDKQITLYWNDYKYISTDEDNVFEVIFPNDFISEFINKRLDNESNSN